MLAIPVSCCANRLALPSWRKFLFASESNSNGARFTLNASGMLAACIQHEMDHLQGKVFIDYLSELKQNRVRTKLKKRQRKAA